MLNWVPQSWPEKAHHSGILNCRSCFQEIIGNIISCSSYRWIARFPNCSPVSNSIDRKRCFNPETFGSKVGMQAFFSSGWRLLQLYLYISCSRETKRWHIEGTLIELFIETTLLYYHWTLITVINILKPPSSQQTSITRPFIPITSKGFLLGKRFVKFLQKPVEIFY